MKFITFTISIVGIVLLYLYLCSFIYWGAFVFLPAIGIFIIQKIAQDYYDKNIKKHP